MSFGFSIGDFLAAIELANKIRKEFVNAPTQFKAITDEVRNLAIVLQDTDVISSDKSLDANQKKDLDEIDQGCQNVLAELQAILDKNSELGSSTGTFGKRLTRAWKRVKWDQEEINGLRNQLSWNINLLNAFNGRLTLDHVVRLVQHQEDQGRQAILDWLAPSGHVAQQSDVLGRRQTGTGQWLLDSPEFKWWTSNTHQTLFCPGIPGAGKTVLTSIVIEELKLKAQHDSSIGVAYLYFDYRRQNERTPENLLATILKQLLQNHNTLPDTVKTFYDNNKNEQLCMSIDALSKAFRSVVGQYSRVFIVVDALDEYCNKYRARFLDVISDLQAMSGTGLNLFATSRFIPEIMKRFENDPLIEIRASEDDVRSYLRGHISRLPIFVQRDTIIQEAIETKIVKVVDGMFLLAQLHLDSLVGKRSPKAVYTALKKLEDQRSSTGKSITTSESYDAAYDEAMTRIKSQVEDARELAEEVISWITLAIRPLTTSELLHALAIEVGEPELDDANISDVEDIVSACAGLVVIDEESNIIRLVHYTTQEYFDRTQKQWFPDAQASIANSCLTYLSFDEFEAGPSPNDDEFEARMGKHCLYDYAARHWGFHACFASPDTEKRILTFFKSKPKLAAATQAMTIQPVKFKSARKHSYAFSQRTPREMTGVHVGAYFGLVGIVRALLDEGCAADSRCSNGQTPLSFAAERGHEEVVRILLAVPDVNPDSQDTLCLRNGERTPLSFAAERGNVEVVRLLLETGCADTNSKTSGALLGGRTPLSFAAEKGHSDVVRQLLTRSDIEADCMDSTGRSPLAFAAQGGHILSVQLLLADGTVNADSMNVEGWTPLAFAAANGHSEVIKPLIETEVVNPNSKNRKGPYRGFTPLMSAVWNNHELAVKALLANGKVDVNGGAESQITDRQTPLMIAAYNGSEPIVKLLLQMDKIDINLTDDEGHTALDHALKRGHSSIVKLLQSHPQGSARSCREEES